MSYATVADVAPAEYPPRRPPADAAIYQARPCHRIGDDTYGTDTETNVQMGRLKPL